MAEGTGQQGQQASNDDLPDPRATPPQQPSFQPPHPAPPPYPPQQPAHRPPYPPPYSYPAQYHPYPGHPPAYPPLQVMACAYHPDRPTGVRCQRCGTPICGDCMVEAPVGHHCRRCLAQGMAATRQGMLPFGGTGSANPALTSIVLVVINVALWLGTFLTGGTTSRLTSLLALTPTGLCERGGDLYVQTVPASCASLGGTYLPGVIDGAWWQVLTSAFMHISPIHLGFNMFVLWMLGPQLERVLGRARFLALYLVSALTGSAAVLWLSAPESTTLGASGAIFGLLAALLVLAIRTGGDVRNILIWLGINVVISVVGAASISWQGHLGGFLGGILLTLALVYLRKGGSRTQWLAVAALTVLTLAAMVARVVLVG